MANQTTTTIASLPAELLGLVFEFCSELKHLDKIKHKKAQLNEPPWHFISRGLSPSQRFGSQVDRFKLLKSGVWFPYSHASVCRYWMEVLSSSPRYWRTVIFHLDSESKPPFDAVSVLSWSKNLPVDIVIVKQDTSSRLSQDTDYMFEKQHVQALVDLLSPHIHRCRSIHIDVHLSSSLPPILWNFTGCPSILESLSLFCDLDDQSHGDELLYSIQPEWGETHSTPLRSLVLDGRNLPDVCSGWLRSQLALEQLVLLNYSVDAKYHIHLDCILETIQNLPHLLRLKFDKVFVLLGSSAVFTSQIQILHFEEVESLIMDEIFRSCIMDELHTIHITRCSILTLPAVSKLVLEDIDPCVSIPSILVDWEGSHLWIGRCRGFGDSFLDMLRMTSDWDDDEFQCPWVETLYLAYLPRFSLKKLKKMIKVRNRFINYDDPNWKTTAPFGPAIRELHVVRCDIAELTEQDMEWFGSRVVTFRYLKQAEPES